MNTAKFVLRGIAGSFIKIAAIVVIAAGLAYFVYHGVVNVFMNFAENLKDVG